MICARSRIQLSCNCALCVFNICGSSRMRWFILKKPLLDNGNAPHTHTRGRWPKEMCARCIDDGYSCERHDCGAYREISLVRCMRCFALSAPAQREFVEYTRKVAFTVYDTRWSSAFNILYTYSVCIHKYCIWAYTQQIQTSIFWIKLALQLSRRVRAEHLHCGMLSLCCLPASFTYILLFYSCWCVCVVYHQSWLTRRRRCIMHRTNRLCVVYCTTVPVLWWCGALRICASYKYTPYSQFSLIASLIIKTHQMRAVHWYIRTHMCCI